MPFTFLDPGLLTDEVLQLHLLVTESAEESMWHAPTYRFEIRYRSDQTRVGHINLRLGNSDVLVRYIGHIGYGIDEPHRGNHHAERACRILLPFTARHGMTTVWITCGPENTASRRTLERLGATFVGIFKVPADYPLPPGSVPEKCRYRVLASEENANVER